MRSAHLRDRIRPRRWKQKWPFFSRERGQFCKCDSTFCRKQKTLPVAIGYKGSKRPLHLLVDSTGIKADGEGENGTHVYRRANRPSYVSTTLPGESPQQGDPIRKAPRDARCGGNGPANTAEAVSKPGCIV